MQSTTYYLLSAKGAALGDGPYLGFDPTGAPMMVPDHKIAQRFPDMDTAESRLQEVKAICPELQIEVRSSAD